MTNLCVGQPVTNFGIAATVIGFHKITGDPILRDAHDGSKWLADPAKCKPAVRAKTCADCIHEYACQAWNCGTLHYTDAQNCANHETVKGSTAYYIGFRDGQKEGALK